MPAATADAAYFPTWQPWQRRDPGGANVPGLQSEHTLAEVADNALENVPGGHDVHSVCPEMLLPYFPSSQGVQAEAPVLSE